LIRHENQDYGHTVDGPDGRIDVPWLKFWRSLFARIVRFLVGR